MASRKLKLNPDKTEFLLIGSKVKHGMDESLGDYREIFIRKYCLAKKLDHLACNAIQG